MATSAGTKSVAIEPSWEECCAYVSTQEATTCSSIPDPVLPDFEGLTPQQVSQAKALFAQYDSIFSMGNGDLGCTSLIAHEILSVDDAPVRQPYR